MLKKFSFIILLFTAITLSAQPKLEIVGGSTYDWGEVKSSESPLKTKMTFKNVGNETLKITQVKPGCGCTTAPLDKNVLQPNETATLDVTLDVKNRSGNVTKTIRVVTNEPENDTKLIYLKCDVYKPVQLFPSFLSFNRLYVGEEGTAKMTIKNLTDKPMTIKEVKVFPNEVNLNIKKGITIPSKGTYEVIAKYTPTAPGRMSATVQLVTDSPEPEAKEITFKGIGRITEKSN